MYQPTRPLPPPRRSHAAVTECTIGDGEQCDYEESQSVILEPLQLTANITRNITLPTKAFPNVDISLSLEAIKVLELEAIKVLEYWYEIDIIGLQKKIWHVHSWLLRYTVCYVFTYVHCICIYKDVRFRFTGK